MITRIPILSSILIICLFMSCGEKSTSSDDITVLAGTIRDAADSSAIANANIIVYNANLNTPVTRTFSNGKGYYSFTIDPETYYLSISAQGYIPSPPPLGSALPFHVIEKNTTVKDIYLNIDHSSVSTGSISGYVYTPELTGINGVLVVATNQAGTNSASGSSGPDGFYVIYNVTPDVYSIKGYASEYAQDTTTVTNTVIANSSVSNKNITLRKTATATLSGKVTFLSSENSIVDITLIHPVTREAIPGLSTFNESGLTYQLTAIPPGTYIAWATYRNDGYVMDPDWIIKNGLPLVTVTTSDTQLYKDFSVTDVVEIVSPTNHPDTISATTVSTVTPTFQWLKYPSAKEYIVEVFKSNGEVIWGGFDSSGVVKHAQFVFQDTGTVFNFDGSASESLKPGEIYRWKIYADSDDAKDIQGLISASEDLLGLFTVDTAKAE